MIGQTKLLAQLNNYTLETLPHTSLLLGESGCGKHTMAQYLAKRLYLPVVNIDNSVTTEDLVEYQYCPVSKMYLIDIDQLDEKQQNKFLKFIEEPSKTVFICLLAASEINVLPTILNRCIKFSFSPYTKEELRSIKDYANDFVYDICTTPGQLLVLNSSTIDKLIDSCAKIVKYVNRATFSNTLSLATTINYKDLYDKFDFDLFFRSLIKIAYQDYLETNSPVSFFIYTFTIKYTSLLVLPGLNKEAFMLNYLTNLWQEVSHI